jgi:RNase P/RNase MRP subunit p29
VISDEQLESLRQSGVKVRVVRDANPDNDVRGYVVAWDDKEVLIRRPNRRVIKLSREYTFEIIS